MNTKIEISTQTERYTINFGVLEKIELGEYSKVLLVTNHVVGGLHLDRVMSKITHQDLSVLLLDDGEENKNFVTLQKIIDFALQKQLDRKSVMIALGGGVISDIVGFASGIYQRGIAFINIPTTLLAQVDASVGGKTGINTIYGKNLVGLFHQPSAVYIDTDFLQTLPTREFVSGIAEIIKIAVCFDFEFFTFLEKCDLKNPQDLQKAVQKSVALKAKIVAKDEKERGVRAGLNYGHTFGHVIELETEYKKYLHGEAVAMGILMANVLAYKEGLLTLQEKDRIFQLLQTYGLSLHYEIKNTELFYQKFFLDKKTQNQKLHFILPDGIGNVRICNDITKDRIMEVLGEFS